MSVAVCLCSIAITSASGEDMAAEPLNQFSWKLFQNLSASDDPAGNILISPYSVGTALGMAGAGARQETASEIRSVLGFESAEEEWQASLGKLTRDLNRSRGDGAPDLIAANRLWAQEGYPLVPGFLQQIASEYAGGLDSVDFSGNPLQARDTINRWVAEMTQQMIPEVIPAGRIDPTTRLIITNAVYLKAQWKAPFESIHTKAAPFFLNAEKKIDVPFMTQWESHSVGNGDSCQLIELLYLGDDLSMIILVPDKMEGVDELVAGLTSAKFEVWLKNLAQKDVKLLLPKFSFQRDLELSGSLRELGIKAAFDSSMADFSGISGNRDLFIGNVFHTTRIRLDEKGTEVAAATAIKHTMAMRKYQEIRVDRPFLFVIRDKKNGTNLFIGKVIEPKAE